MPIEIVVAGKQKGRFCFLMTTMAEPNLTTLFLEFSRRKLLEEYWPRLRGCVESLVQLIRLFESPDLVGVAVL